MPLLKEDIYTIKDIYALPDGERAELIEGKIYDMAPPSAAHQRILIALSTAIYNYIDNNNGSCSVYIAPFAVFLNEDDKNYVEPDISVICNPDKLDDKGCNGAPDWVIEIVSPSSQRMDYMIKLFKYRTAGVREYWIVDSLKNRITVYNFEEDREMLIGTILSKVLLLVLLFYVILKKLHKEAEGIDRKLWVILFLISIESICMAFIFYELYNGKNQIWIISFYTLLLLMNVSIFEIYKKSIYSLKLEKENMIYEQQLKLLRNCTQDQMNSTALFQREQHDFKNKLLGIRSSMEKQNVQDAIRMIDGILEHGNMVDKAELEKIGNDIIDTILRFKYAKAIQKNIVVKIDGFAMQKLPILDEDLCVVLGNMLDNAIEASEKVTDRWINVSIGLRKNGLVIVVENSFDGIIKKNIHGNIISIKENKEHHGYGLKSIRKTVEKYDGELVVEIRGNIFRAVAFMTCIDYV